MFTEHDDRLRVESSARICYDTGKVPASSYNLHCVCFVQVVRRMAVTHIGDAGKDPMPKGEVGTAEFYKKIRNQIFVIVVPVAGAVLPAFH